MKRLVQFALSIAVTIGFGWYAFHDTNWNAQLESLKTARWGWLALYFATLLGVHLCRTLRWGCYLSGLEKVPFRKLNEASAIGFMMLIVLPFRLGEFARPYLIAQRSGIKKSAAMASVVLERITDGITVAVMLRVLLFFVPANAPQIRLAKFAGNTMFTIFASGFVFLLFAIWQERRAIALVRWSAGIVSPRLAEKMVGIVETFVRAMRALPSAGQTVGFFFFTALYWALNGWGMAMVASAFGCDAGIGCLPFGLTAFQGYVVMGVLVVAVMIPSAPGMLGTFQAGVKLGLGLFLPAAALVGKGIAYANVVWFAQTSAQVGLGLIFLSIGKVSFGDLAGKLSEEGKGETDTAAAKKDEDRAARVGVSSGS